MRPGDVLTLRYAGGGGYGEPKERAPLALEHDLRNELVSPEAAREIYGHG